ncbi:tetratricopeptide repeat protein [Rhizobium leguminosarum]|uniref:tetratricopeptide repeat protein n=1 Tax=Rhizobium leguminosarum TaxID=384 RepID=UPI0024A8D29F|nr:tetratricopeptide repeat protein [Rhizobium leguminosarum]MDI5925225.1 tetratricopeptide repeat protein [Rhizobium leguminosarum]
MFGERSAVGKDRTRKALTDWVRRSSARILIVAGAPGFGQLEAIRDGLTSPDSRLIEASGNWRTEGYLAGFHELVDELLIWSEQSAPDLVARYEQSLKRLFPYRSSNCYRIPKDLTNSSDREERTRFYHNEYQNKLLVGLAEFLLEGLNLRQQTVVLVIDNADQLSITSKSLISIIARINPDATIIRFVLMDWNGTLFLPNAETVSASVFSRENFDLLLEICNSPVDQREIIYQLSAGNIAKGQALLTCMRSGVNLSRSLAFLTILDLYLATLDVATKEDLAFEFVSGKRGSDKIAERCADTLRTPDLSRRFALAHATALQDFKLGNGVLRVCYAAALFDQDRSLDAIVDVCEILMEIGLYDTWFDIFSAHFSDHYARHSHDCNGRIAGLFINAAFVLYAMGNSTAAHPFLEEFLQRFPLSRFVPTALYAQSMIYGRYQLPIDLPRAEACAIKNLQQIEDHFRDHRKYRYIRVFAENAYAYIKARQGKFPEALEICERGNAEIVSEYGDTAFLLHRSILIYNTSQIYEFMGNYERAEAQLRAAMDLDPFYAEYHNDLGNLLSKVAGREGEALEAYARAIELSPPYYEAYLNRGQLLAELGNYAEAIQDFNSVLHIKPEEWRALREIANVEAVRGNPSAALSLYLEALAYEPNDADLHANAGFAYSELDRSSKAFEHYLRAIALSPKHAEAHNNLGIEFLNDGRLDEALHHLREACEYGSEASYKANLTEAQRRIRMRDQSRGMNSKA